MCILNCKTLIEKKAKQGNFFSGRSVPDPKTNSSLLTLGHSSPLLFKFPIFLIFYPKAIVCSLFLVFIIFSRTNFSLFWFCLLFVHFLFNWFLPLSSLFPIVVSPHRCAMDPPTPNLLQIWGHIHTPRAYENVYYSYHEAFWGEQDRLRCGSQNGSRIQGEMTAWLLLWLGGGTRVEFPQAAATCVVSASHWYQGRECLGFLTGLSTCTVGGEDRGVGLENCQQIAKKLSDYLLHLYLLTLGLICFFFILLRFKVKAYLVVLIFYTSSYNADFTNYTFCSTYFFAAYHKFGHFMF